MAAVFSVSKAPFGKIGDEPVWLFTMQNPGGMKVCIANYGATVTHLWTPDRDGKPGDVVLGFDTLEGYLQKGNPYFGCIVGRYANRIAGAQFELDGKIYRLPANDGANCLHGGGHGMDKKIWSAEMVERPDAVAVKLEVHSPDGEEGFPGNLHVTVIYSLTADNALIIEYSATSNAPTPVNLTNHSYFNLSAGAAPTVLDHKLWLNATRYTPVNQQLIPTGLFEKVENTPLDFTTAKPIARNLSGVGIGYDHNFVLDKKPGELAHSATVFEPVSGRTMEMFTTEPGVQLYTSNFLDGALIGKWGKGYPRYAALCLEAQHFPDSPNQPAFPNTILRPDAVYRQTTVYRFGIE